MNALLRSTAIIEFDLGGNIITANDAFLNVMGYQLDQIKSKHHGMFCDPTRQVVGAVEPFTHQL
ncbi:PAS domain S-box protein [Pseudomonas syringae]|uniref:PAS domain S-box protein n=1 Tax=Pseudomonas syringae TaxID=317 RepID=UPI0011119C94